MEYTAYRPYRNFREAIEHLQDHCWFEHVISYGAGLAFLETELALQGKEVICYDKYKSQKTHWETLVKRSDTDMRYIVKDVFKIKQYKRTELAICCELVQFYPDEVAIPFLKNICKNCNFLLFSSTMIPSPTTSAKDAQNYKWPGEWQDIIKGHGMEFRAWYNFPHRNAMIFENRYKEILA